MPSTTTTKVNIGLTYADSTSRTVSFDNVREEQIPNISTRVQAINANMSDAFKRTFVSAEGSPVIAIGKAQVVTTEEEMIYSVN